MIRFPFRRARPDSEEVSAMPSAEARLDSAGASLAGPIASAPPSNTETEAASVVGHAHDTPSAGAGLASRLIAIARRTSATSASSAAPSRDEATSGYGVGTPRGTPADRDTYVPAGPNLDWRPRPDFGEPLDVTVVPAARDAWWHRTRRLVVRRPRPATGVVPTAGMGRAATSVTRVATAAGRLTTTARRIAARFGRHPAAMDVVSTAFLLLSGATAGAVYAHHQAEAPAVLPPSILSPRTIIASPTPSAVSPVPGAPESMAAAGTGPSLVTTGPRADVADWADSLHVPPWVLTGRRGGWPVSSPSEDALATAAAGGERGSALNRGASIPSTPAVDMRQVTPYLVQRLAGASVVAAPLTETGAIGALPAALPRALSVPGRCEATMQVDAAQSGTLVARETRGLSTWITAIAVPDEACLTAARQRAVIRAVPTPIERIGLAQATGTGPVAGALAGPRFTADELRDVVIGTVDGERLAWGVFRRPPRGTQLVPPPPHPQLAFVARALSPAATTWELLWGVYTAAPEQTYGLAGVYDFTGNGSPAALFTVRTTGAAGQLLRLTGRGRTWSAAAVGALTPAR